MKKIFIIKAVNPNWGRKEYSEYGIFDANDEAKNEKLRLQGLGFVRVCIKQRISR